ncbi:MAG: RAMP superfamily CRISPR-associated protein [Bacteroidales bacterium]|nr:RAMP superfamily CRISPR-associated protein [Bacteroidales bacterium]
MKEVNNKYYIKLTAVTPLSVGAGNEEEWVKCADYVIHDGKVYVLDLHRVAEEGVDLAKLSNLFLGSDHDGIVNILAGKLETVSAFVFDLPSQTENNIKAFERSQFHNLPVVAGSSLKGALRSILFKYLRDYETKNEEVFGTMKDGTDFMRFIKVGDVEMPATKLYNTKIYNLHSVDGHWQGGWKHALVNGTNDFYRSTGFNTLYECIEPSVNGFGTLMLSSTDLESVIQKVGASAHGNKKMNILHDGVSAFFAIVNDFTRKYLQKERAFFEKYPADRTDDILDCIDHLLAMIPSDNSSCLMKMSAGVGFHAITGDWQYEDYSKTGVHENGRHAGKQKYKSRKIAETPEGLALMGFVKLSAVSEDDYCAYVKNIEDNFNAQMQGLLEKKAEAEADAKAAEAARLEKEANYAGCIAAALEAETAGDFALALSKAQEAIELFTNRDEASAIITRCESKAAEQLLASQQAASAAAADAAREQKVAGGLAALLNEKFELGDKVGLYKVADFKLCFQKVAQWAKAAKLDALPEEQKLALTETLKRLLAAPSKKEVKDLKNRKSSIWRNVEKWLSASTADEMFESVN